MEELINITPPDNNLVVMTVETGIILGFLSERKLIPPHLLVSAFKFVDLRTFFVIPMEFYRSAPELGLNEPPESRLEVTVLAGEPRTGEIPTSRRRKGGKGSWGWGGGKVPSNVWRG